MNAEKNIDVSSCTIRAEINEVSDEIVAEREGFEPSIPVSQYTRLAGERLRPTRPSLQNLTQPVTTGLFIQHNKLLFPFFEINQNQFCNRLEGLEHPFT